MKIYTRTGDTGETSLFAGGRVSKGHVRLQTYGTVDELNAILGVTLAANLSEKLLGPVRRVQSELFVAGADLATPLDAKTDWVVRVVPSMIERLEVEIDEWEAQLPPLKHFILPGGGLAGAFLHEARTVCRRAERWLVTLQEAEPVNPEVLRYVNRLSDWLFVAARLENLRAGYPETVWQRPKEGR
jgi:cob(I)alamin adenosyltransferase